jgi:hypothetical protein
VPSEERDWTSVNMRRAHIPQDQWSTVDAATSSDWTSANMRRAPIPQDQGSTAGAATISGLSQGRASRRSWQSRDEKQETLLDAIIVETPEVKPESEE